MPRILNARQIAVSSDLSMRWLSRSMALSRKRSRCRSELPPFIESPRRTGSKNGQERLLPSRRSICHLISVSHSVVHVFRACDQRGDRRRFLPITVVRHIALQQHASADHTHRDRRAFQFWFHGHRRLHARKLIVGEAFRLETHGSPPS
ncbi:hypothetical protein RHECNPAF_890072 [Rhizobium etli CNPAF512]|nr:hypothetical protein RHECNPAF_890072 [Rhizobium etli CNPAF512]